MYGRHENATAALDPDRGQAGPPEANVAHRLSVLLGIRGLLAVVFGVLVLAWPGITILALALVFAAYVMADGIGMLVSGVHARGGRRWSYLLAGVVGLIAGLGALLWPGLTALVLVLWAGAWAVVTGALEIAAAVRGKGSARWLTALAGAASIVAGLIIFTWPGIGALGLAIALGVYALAAGVSYFSAAWQARQAPVVAVPV